MSSRLFTNAPLPPLPIGGIPLQPVDSAVVVHPPGYMAPPTLGRARARRRCLPRWLSFLRGSPIERFLCTGWNGIIIIAVIAIATLVALLVLAAVNLTNSTNKMTATCLKLDPLGNCCKYLDMEGNCFIHNVTDDDTTLAKMKHSLDDADLVAADVLGHDTTYANMKRSLGDDNALIADVLSHDTTFVNIKCSVDNDADLAADVLAHDTTLTNMKRSCDDDDTLVADVLDHDPAVAKVKRSLDDADFAAKPTPFFVPSPNPNVQHAMNGPTTTTNGFRSPSSTLAPTTFLALATPTVALPVLFVYATSLLHLQQKLTNRQSEHHDMMGSHLRELTENLAQPLNKEAVELANDFIEEMLAEMGAYEGFLEGLEDDVVDLVRELDIE
ncbi:uncharacterized protein LY89DRAFT_357405 [Mollisia scopiformis]|uniref:Transmembrane protein n=1 Tax=Mollisia scopiformis TaxID=149040 RepID=A0A132B555_MOLSC|nr:uncharacterized protein LY89DRAFT_357405 [Mollisia scopiformis]KUJ07546.1 hypothetical protein LY89DRAFT_357405 [Mollisia scopiformis]